MDRSEFPLARGVVGGLVAYVVGYLLTYLWQAPNVRDTISGLNTLIEMVGGETIPVWQVVGWVFYNAHAVPLQIPGMGAGTTTRSLIGNGGAPSLLFVLPPLVLLLAGAGIAWWTKQSDLSDGAVAGGSIILGYVVLAVVGVFVFRYTLGDAFVGPVPARGVLLAGILYPAVFGAIGGGLAAEIR